MNGLNGPMKGRKVADDHSKGTSQKFFNAIHNNSRQELNGLGSFFAFQILLRHHLAFYR